MLKKKFYNKEKLSTRHLKIDNNKTVLLQLKFHLKCFKTQTMSKVFVLWPSREFFVDYWRFNNKPADQLTIKICSYWFLFFIVFGNLINHLLNIITCSIKDMCLKMLLLNDLILFISNKLAINKIIKICFCWIIAQNNRIPPKTKLWK